MVPSLLIPVDGLHGFHCWAGSNRRGYRVDGNPDRPPCAARMRRYAENHNPTGVYAGRTTLQGAGFDTTPYPEGDYYTRIAAALQSMFEYFPLREGAAVLTGTGNVGSAAADLATITAAAAAAYPGPYLASGGGPTAAYISAGSQARTTAAAQRV